MSKCSHLVIAEDDQFVQQLLAAFFRNEGFHVDPVGSGRELLATLDDGPVDLVLLDLGLPDEDGLVLMRQIRSRSTVPIIVLTGRKEHDDRIAALAMGADDYLTKPCDPQELVLRAVNLLSRSNGSQPGANARQWSSRFTFEGWTMDLSARSLHDSAGTEVHLSRSEFNVLSALVMAANKVMTRAQLLDAISQCDSSHSERMIDVIVARLRRKIEPDPRNPRIITTLVGVGYKFAGHIGHAGGD